MPLAAALSVDLDALLDVHDDDDVVIRPTPDRFGARTTWMLSRPTGRTQAIKMRLEPTAEPPTPRVHPGHDWMVVIEGRVRLTLGERDIVVETGEAAEFATMTPHAVVALGGPAELIMIFDSEGQRAHVHSDGTGRTGVLTGPPLVVTALLDGPLQRRFDAERQRLFPAGRTQVGAHVTLFHAVPGDEIDAVRAALEAEQHAAPPPLRVTGVRSLGKGAAYVIDSPGLAAVHKRLAAAWWPRLTPQDRQPFRSSHHRAEQGRPGRCPGDRRGADRGVRRGDHDVPGNRTVALHRRAVGAGGHLPVQRPGLIRRSAASRREPPYERGCRAWPAAPSRG